VNSILFTQLRKHLISKTEGNAQMTVKPFKIDVPQDVLDDLQERLADTRWPDEVEGAGWSYGTSLSYMKALVAYWQNQFDWRRQEAELNQLPQFMAEIDGLNIHFIHMRGKGSNSLPLLLTHGWPDSFYRFHKVIPMLTDPASYGGDAADSFDVVIPSVPGYGFSDRPTQKGMSSERVAALFHKLMTDVLGYERYAAQGGDIGSVVSLQLAHQQPQSLVGIHVTDVSYPFAPPQGMEMDEAGQQYLDALNTWWYTEGAYSAVQGTKPQSVAYGLNDSPAGMAAWFISFGSNDSLGHGETLDWHGFTIDELLTNLMIYWVTQTAGSAARMYREPDNNPLYPARSRIEVPTAVAKFPGDLVPPRSWVEHDMNLQRWTEFEEGQPFGHFAAIKVPEVFVNDLREFLRPLR
jgi:pimeloyl-ACP methyl ester carboxylesterase